MPSTQTFKIGPNKIWTMRSWNLKFLMIRRRTPRTRSITKPYQIFWYHCFKIACSKIIKNIISHSVYCQKMQKWILKSRNLFDKMFIDIKYGFPSLIYSKISRNLFDKKPVWQMFIDIKHDWRFSIACRECKCRQSKMHLFNIEKN